MKHLDAFYEPIGRMIVAFQNAESTLSLMIVALVNEDPRVTMALVTGMSFSRRLDALRSLAPFKMDQTLSGELADIVNELGKCENSRNMIVHSSWIASLDGRQVLRLKPNISRKKGLRDSVKKAQVSDVTDVTKAIHAAHSKLLRFVEKLTTKRIITIKAVEEVQ